MIWESTLDDKYKCYVERKSEYVGQLNMAIGRTVIFSQDVYLRSGAQFGPDAEDIHQWQLICADYVDGRK